MTLDFVFTKIVLKIIPRMNLFSLPRQTLIGVIGKLLIFAMLERLELTLNSNGSLHKVMVVVVMTTQAVLVSSLDVNLLNTIKVAMPVQDS